MKRCPLTDISPIVTKTSKFYFQELITLSGVRGSNI